MNVSISTSNLVRPPSAKEDDEQPIRILAIGGSTRSGSASEVALRVACRAAEVAGAEVDYVVGRDLMLPIYDTEEESRSSESSRLVQALAKADGVIISSPGYHGSMSGMVKNALDYAEDLRRMGISYLDGKAIGCISVAYGWQAAVSSLQHLRTVAHALRGWPTPLGVAVNSSVVSMELVEQDPANAHAAQLRTVGSQVLTFAQAMRGLESANRSMDNSFGRTFG